jgi:cell division septation protein DedD
MKNYTLRCAFMAIVAILAASPPAIKANNTPLGDSLTFFEKNITEVQRIAAQEGKAYFIHFTADWVMPCQWMEEETFADPVLVAFIKKSFLPVKADIDSPQGTSLKSQYGVTSLPSILVFSSRGQLLGTHEGALEAEALLDWLKPFDTPANKAAFTEAEPENILSSPKALVNISRPALLPETSVQPFTKVEAAQPAVQNPVYASTETWRVPSYFTVQVDVFSSYENALDRIQDLESSTRQQAHSSKDNVNGKDLYRVFVGRLSNRSKAIELQQALKKQGINGFVKKIDI